MQGLAETRRELYALCRFGIIQEENSMHYAGAGNPTEEYTMRYAGAETPQKKSLCTMQEVAAAPIPGLAVT